MEASAGTLTMLREMGITHEGLLRYANSIVKEGGDNMNIVLKADKDLFALFLRSVANKGISMSHNIIKSDMDYVGVNVWDGDSIKGVFHVFTEKW